MSQNLNPKLCVDCKWFGGPRHLDSLAAIDASLKNDVCMHAYTQIEDLVRGGKYPALCADVRSVVDPYCGVAGRLFEDFED
jgi:hypothetical protein